MTDLARLRQLAEAATAGPWATYLHFHVVQASVPDDDVIDDETWFSADLYGPKSAADAAYIAAFNPTTAAALLDEVESLRAALRDAYDAMDAATKWAAHQRPESDTLPAVTEHLRGYDALLDAQVRAGQTLGVLSGALLEAEPLDPEGAPR